MYHIGPSISHDLRYCHQEILRVLGGQFPFSFLVCSGSSVKKAQKLILVDVTILVFYTASAIAREMEIIRTNPTLLRLYWYWRTRDLMPVFLPFFVFANSLSCYYMIYTIVLNTTQVQR